MTWVGSRETGCGPAGAVRVPWDGVGVPMARWGPVGAEHLHSAVRGERRRMEHRHNVRGADGEHGGGPRREHAADRARPKRELTIGSLRTLTLAVVAKADDLTVVREHHSEAIAAADLRGMAGSNS